MDSAYMPAIVNSAILALHKGDYVRAKTLALKALQLVPGQGEAMMALSEAQLYLFKNHGKLGGASIYHEHSQIVGLPFIPEIPLCEFSYKGKCVYCAAAKKNVVFQNAEFAVVRPEFARFELECWIIPKKHVDSFVDFDKRTAALFMQALQETIRRVKRKTTDYNVAFHASCKAKKVHFHVEVYPHTATWAGLELGAGVIVNQMDEKTALKVLRA